MSSIEIDHASENRKQKLKEWQRQYKPGFTDYGAVILGLIVGLIFWGLLAIVVLKYL